MSIKDTEYKGLDDDDELPTYDKIQSLDNDITEDTSSYYNETENIFYSLPPSNDTFMMKSYKEIMEIDDLLTVVLADVKNPPSFILNNFSFIEYGFHKKLMKYTPKNCTPISTKIVLICQKESFESYKLFLTKPKNIANLAIVLAQKDFFCCPINIFDLINIKRTILDKIFDIEGDTLLFSNSDSRSRYRKRKFNFHTIRQCINSDQFIMERLEALSDEDYDSHHTGITNNTILFDERNYDFHQKFRRIKKNEDETTPDFIDRKIEEKNSRAIKYKNEFNQILDIVANLIRISKYCPKNDPDNKNEEITQTDIVFMINMIINRLFTSHKHYIFALRSLDSFHKMGIIIKFDSIWSAIYASYVEECSAILKVSEHTFRNYTDEHDTFMYTEDDIPLLNKIKSGIFIQNNKERSPYSCQNKDANDLFIPLRRRECGNIPSLPKDYDGKRTGYRLNTLEEFRERFDIFTRGLFKNFDWMNGKCLVSGSCITACLAHYNKCGENIKEFKKYIDKNYAKSDVDMCTTSELLPLLQRRILNIYKRKEQSLTGLFKRSKTTVTLCANITKYVTNIDELNDFTKVMETDSKTNESIVSYKCTHCGYKQEMSLFMTGESHFIKCKMVDEHINKSSRYGAKIYKMAIDTPFNEKYFRSVDVYCNTLGKIGLYHMPVVRAAYTGEKLYMYPSFVCAAMSGYCPDYKWFKGKKNPLGIILDKWMKGYNIILNNTEQLQLMSYFIYNHSKEAKTKTPLLEPYRTRWDYTFSDHRNIQRICRRMDNHLHAVDCNITSSRMVEHLKKIIYNNLV
jgi:hypothetical protein